MYELNWVSETCGYIESPAKIGLVRTGEGEAVLIDSGNDKDAGKKVLRILEGQGLRLKAIYNTHSHADHIGGNAFLQEKTGCRIYAPGIEQAFTAHPILEPSFLYGGHPPKDLRHKFLMAKESRAELLTEEVLPAGLRMIYLPGHSFDMVGFQSPDGVTYLADCLSSHETLEKYQVVYLVDVESYLKTLEYVCTLPKGIYIPSHAACTEDIRELAEENIQRTLQVGARLCEICEKPLGFDEILREVFQSYQLEMTFSQHALLGSTVRSYLTWLQAQGRVEAKISEEVLCWKAL